MVSEANPSPARLALGNGREQGSGDEVHGVISKPFSGPARARKRARAGLRRRGTWCHKQALLRPGSRSETTARRAQETRYMVSEASPSPARLALGNGREQGSGDEVHGVRSKPFFGPARARRRPRGGLRRRGTWCQKQALLRPGSRSETGASGTQETKYMVS